MGSGGERGNKTDDEVAIFRLVLFINKSSGKGFEVEGALMFWVFDLITIIGFL